MKYFKRKTIMSILFLFSGIIIFFSGSLQLMMNNSGSAFFLILVALLFVFDAYIYKKPYLGLDEEKLVVNNSLLKKEIFLKDLTSISEKNNKLSIRYTQGPLTQTINILLSHLKKHDQEQFLKELKSRLGDQVRMS
ncbi:EbsA family protein [Desulfosporosinus sp. SB140]|uniref:EbsA family protein n=1 Tax=Desulfosporosinus paludis TaxID=3115649 RepID=UPI00388ED23D